jgi:uncharacterized protein YjbJ (UPF0337 family)
MDRQHIKGAADKAKGAVKDAVGGLTGDAKLQTEGKVDKEGRQEVNPGSSER